MAQRGNAAGQNDRGRAGMGCTFRRVKSHRVMRIKICGLLPTEITSGTRARFAGSPMKREVTSARLVSQGRSRGHDNTALLPDSQVAGKRVLAG